MSHYEINFDHILDVALRGVRRASLFIGFGVNAATDPAFKSHALTKFSNLQIGPAELSDQALAEAKESFRLWIEAAGFRELTDTFGVFLDAVHLACVLSKQVSEKGEISKRKFELAEAQQTSFVEEGVPNKLNIIFQRFNIEAQHGEQLKSLNKARNCLTHRRGIVASQDLTDGVLPISWLGMDLVAVEPDGKEHSIRHDSPPIYFPEGAQVMAKMTMRIREFIIGDVIGFSTRELAEICWFYEREARYICLAAIEYAKLSGIPASDSTSAVLP